MRTVSKVLYWFGRAHKDVIHKSIDKKEVEVIGEE